MRGGVRVGDTVELPELRQQKKIKSMQMFRWGQELSWSVSRALPEQFYSAQWVALWLCDCAGQAAMQLVGVWRGAAQRPWVGKSCQWQAAFHAMLN